MSNQSQTSENEHPVEDVNELIKQRHSKLDLIKQSGKNPYPNQFKRKEYAQDLQQQFADKDKETLANSDKVMVTVAGRIMLKRVMGKASFDHCRHDRAYPSLCQQKRLGRRDL